MKKGIVINLKDLWLMKIMRFLKYDKKSNLAQKEENKFKFFN